MHGPQCMPLVWPSSHSSLQGIILIHKNTSKNISNWNFMIHYLQFKKMYLLEANIVLQYYYSLLFSGIFTFFSSDRPKSENHVYFSHFTTFGNKPEARQLPDSLHMRSTLDNSNQSGYWYLPWQEFQLLNHLASPQLFCRIARWFTMMEGIGISNYINC